MRDIRHPYTYVNCHTNEHSSPDQHLHAYGNCHADEHSSADRHTHTPANCHTNSCYGSIGYFYTGCGHLCQRWQPEYELRHIHCSAS